MSNGEEFEKWFLGLIFNNVDGDYFGSFKNELHQQFTRIQELEAKNAEMLAALVDASDYLRSNKLNQIGSGSILHRQMMDAIERNSK